MAMIDEGGRLPDPVTGEEPVDRDAFAKHKDSFDRALDNALEKAAARWPKPSMYDCDVTLSVRASFTNPGEVGTYRVTLTPTGQVDDG